MFVGHYGVSLAAKGADRRIPLCTRICAAEILILVESRTNIWASVNSSSSTWPILVGRTHGCPSLTYCGSPSTADWLDAKTSMMPSGYPKIRGNCRRPPRQPDDFRLKTLNQGASP